MVKFIMLLFLFLYFNSFSLVNFFNDRKYLLNMNISHSYESSRNDTVLYVLFKDSLIPKDVCEWSMDYNIKGAYFVGIHFSIGLLILLYIKWGFHPNETLINLILNKLNLFIFKDSHCFHGKWIDIFQLLNLVFQMNICCNLWMKQAWLAIQITQCVIHLLVSIQLQLPRDGPVVTNVFLKKTIFLTFLITKYKLMLNIN